MVGYAFGTAGDIDIANIKPTQEQIRKLVQEAELTKKTQQALKVRMT